MERSVYTHLMIWGKILACSTRDHDVAMDARTTDSRTTMVKADPMTVV